MDIRQWVSAGILLALTACSGAGLQTAVPRATDRFATASIRFVVPKKITAGRRTPLYLGSTNSLRLEVLTVNGSAPSPAFSPIVFSVASANCSGSPLTCSFSAAVPIGSDTFRFTTYNSSDGSGVASASATTTAQTIVKGAANNVNVGLNGEIYTIAPTPTDLYFTAGTYSSQSISAAASDFGGTAITTDSFFAPITAAVQASPSGNLSLSAASFAAPPASMNVIYNGGLADSAPAVVLSSSTAAAAATVHIHFSYSLNVNPTSVNLTFNGTTYAGSTASITVSEPGSVGPFTATPTTDGDVYLVTPSTATASSAGASVSFTVQSYDVGGSTFSITDGHGNSQSISVVSRCVPISSCAGGTGGRPIP